MYARHRIDQVLEREAGVDEVLDDVLAPARHVATHARRVVRHAVDHLAVGLREEVVVLEEVDVRADVRHHDLLIGRRVALEQIRVRRVGVDHHLVDLRQAPLVALASCS